MGTESEMNDLTAIIKDAIVNRKMDKKDYICQYCQNGYRKESTLMAHHCEPKRRALQEKEAGVVLAFTAYIRFYEMTQGSAKFKTYKDFCESSFYNAFVKFGRHMVSIRAINTTRFIEFVIKNNKKLDYWCQDKVYQEYLYDYLRKESVQDALERSIKTMERWAEEKESVFNHYFNYINGNVLAQHIVSGRISSWVIFNCNSGIGALDKLNTEQIEMIFPYIDPDHWNRKFKDYFADTVWVKHILTEAGL